ncbi:hypothetical protein BHE74_00030884 [Ensete ventricosum]|nr:hypothetical protein BHE74_00030884 [Ensete ventricosum]
MSSSGSSSVRVVPSASLEGTQLEGWATSVSGSLHSGIPSPEDARSRRDLEAMKSYHDITSAISEEALESIRECYSIPEGYVLEPLRPSAIGLTMAERHVSSTIGPMMAERHVSGTIGLTMAERHVLSTIGPMMAERHVSSTIGLTMAERHVSGTIGLTMAEWHVLGMIGLMMA